MKVRISNKIKLKKNLEPWMYRQKIYNLLNLIIPEYESLYGTKREFYDRLTVDEFDDYLYHFWEDYNRVIKIKEQVSGMWILRFPPALGRTIAVCYVYEPKFIPPADSKELVLEDT